jgi:hypothetical protein
MASQSPRVDTERAGVPRWVVISGIIAAIIVLGVVIVLLTGLGGEHGPGRHEPGAESSSATPASSMEHTPPAGGH